VSIDPPSADQGIASPDAAHRVRAAVRKRCLAEIGAWLDHPFGPTAEVYKVADRMFAVLTPGDEQRPARVTLKCDPDFGRTLRDAHPSISPGYHTDKRNWITVTLDGSLEGDLLDDLVDASYELVVAKLPRREREALDRPRSKADA
jgi:predicted DNA-binding protein (MmcQ/YjbR family)